LKLRPRVGPLDTIASIECLVHPWNAMTLREEAPTDSLRAKVNLRYCVAAALVFGKLSHRELMPECLNNPVVLSLMKKISISISDDLPDNAEFPAAVAVTRTDGQQMTERCDVPPGGSSRPLSYADLVAKFEDCAETALSATDTARAIAALR